MSVNSSTLLVAVEANTDAPRRFPPFAMEGFVARDVHRKELVVALRGSASVADVLLDTQVQLVPLVSPGVSIPRSQFHSSPDDVQVHAGFLTAWNSVGVQVLAILAEQLVLHGDIKTIVTSGHSLGGALATLSAISANQRFPQCRVITYSYGAPRTGNKAFAEFVNKSLGENAFRVVHTHDGVPTMIPQSLGYHHHGIEYWQEYEPAIAENVVKCEPQGEDPSCSLSIPSGGVNDAHMKYFGIVITTPFCL
ncbi:Alpha/Beta hydrolase protein [Lentinula edodes]|nr:Alpha/Beta hydrolase protein [Lentinula edodes]